MTREFPVRDLEQCWYSLYNWFLPSNMEFVKYLGYFNGWIFKYQDKYYKAPIPMFFEAKDGLVECIEVDRRENKLSHLFCDFW